MVVLGALAASAVTGCGLKASDSSPLIIGGRPASNAYPFFVTLTDGPGKRPFCGAVHIEPTPEALSPGPALVLTAAHCAVDLPPAATVRFQSGNSAVPAVDIAVRRLIVHEKFESTALHNDVAVLLLAGKAPAWAQALPVEQLGGQPAVGDKLRVIGVGNQTSIGWLGESPKDSLMEVDIPLLEPALCKAVYKTFDDKLQLCAADPLGGGDSCQGDSGGPLFAQTEGSGARLEGLVSFGIGCGQAAQPGVYTRVATYRDWITAQASRLRSPIFEPSSAGLTRAFKEGCFSPTSVFLNKQNPKGSLAEERIMTLAGAFRNIHEPRNSGLLRDLLKGKISETPSCVATLDDDTEVKFYWAQTKRDERRNAYQLLVRVFDEPGFSFVAPITFESNWALNCEPPGRPDALLSWNLSLTGNEAQLRLGQQLFLSAGLQKPSSPPTDEHSRVIEACNLGNGASLELRAVESGADAGGYVVTVTNLLGRRSGVDFQHLYQLESSDRASRNLSLSIEAGSEGAPTLLVISNQSTEALYGWRLICERPFELKNLAGQPLPSYEVPKQLPDFLAASQEKLYVVDVLARELPEWALAAGDALRLAISRPAPASPRDPAEPDDSSVEAKVYCDVNGFGSYLDIPLAN